VVNLKEKFPKILSKIEDDIDELRYLIVVDENYEDINDEENDIFDPNDYNYLVYLTEDLQNALGSEVLEKLYKYIDEKKIFEEYIASEIDLYGVKSNLDDEGVALKILEIANNLVEGN